MAHKRTPLSYTVNFAIYITNHVYAGIVSSTDLLNETGTGVTKNGTDGRNDLYTLKAPYPKMAYILGGENAHRGKLDCKPLWA